MPASISEIIAVLLFMQDMQITGPLPAEVKCLSDNIYFEARSEERIGQFAVAHVTLNRVADERWPDSICEVVHQELVPGKPQFSWVNDGLAVEDPVAYENAMTIAILALTGISKDPTDGATFFLRKDLSPGWSRTLETVAVIGDHKFLR